jgi:hypothetical protein
MNGFLLNGFNLKRFQFLIENLTPVVNFELHVHNEGLVDLLPQMRSEDLNKRNL